MSKNELAVASFFSGFEVIDSLHPQNKAKLFNDLNPTTAPIEDKVLGVEGLGYVFHILKAEKIIDNEENFYKLNVVRVSYHSGPKRILVPNDKMILKKT